MIVDGFNITSDSGGYVIGEIGHNHQGSLEKCKELFRVAKECGVNAVKLQKRDNRTLYTKALYESAYNSENAFGSTYGEHREALEFRWDEYVELKRYTQELGITFFATAFDFTSVDFLQSLDMPAYKIASGDLKNTPLQRYIAQTGKPIFLSTGGGTYEDIQRAYDTIMPINRQLCIMQCTAEYPCPPEHMFLLTIPEMVKRFPVPIGLSDHFAGKLMTPIAYVLGARVFEKHFTLCHTWKGTDHAFSLDPEQMSKLIVDLKRVRAALVEGKIPLDGEKPGLYKMGKKLVTSRTMTVGEILTASDIRIVSPNDGLPPYELDSLLGKTLKCSVGEEDALRWEYVE